MPRLFSVASWNVEHFNDEQTRVQRVAEFIAGQHNGPARVPDIFALYEVVGKDIFWEFMNRFPDHRFHLTEGKQTQEIFIGVHKRLTSFVTLRLEFKIQRDFQRPGLLLTVQLKNLYFSFLFLHVRSGSSTEDFGMRDASLIHAFNLKKALDKVSGGQANFIFLGDLNTMGIKDPVPYSKMLDLSPEQEVERIALWSQKRNMMLLDKESVSINGEDHVVTWYNGSRSYQPANLDHVVASDHMDIRSEKREQGKVSVLGWPKLFGSRHALL